MQELDVNQTILIVVGSDIKPEEKDRPIAYRLKGQIESHPAYGKLPFRKCIVISDSLYEEDKIIQVCPTICIGGPGVNAAAARLFKTLPIYHNHNDRFFIQLDADRKARVISIWGMDQSSTEEAVNYFMAAGLLNEFLKSVWN